jgi:uncharacterized protein VirK/YbjX
LEQYEKNGARAVASFPSVKPHRCTVMRLFHVRFLMIRILQTRRLFRILTVLKKSGFAASLPAAYPDSATNRIIVNGERTQGFLRAVKPSAG